MQLSEAEDRFKFHGLIARSMRAIGNNDRVQLFVCFTEDGVLDTPVPGGTFGGREGQPSPRCRSWLRRVHHFSTASSMAHAPE